MGFILILCLYIMCFHHSHHPYYFVFVLFLLPLVHFSSLIVLLLFNVFKRNLEFACRENYISFPSLTYFFFFNVMISSSVHSPTGDLILLFYFLQLYTIPSCVFYPFIC